MPPDDLRAQIEPDAETRDMQGRHSQALPDERIYTFWDYLRNAYGRDAGLRLDHFLLNDALEKRLASAGVDKEVRGWEHSSDHAPVWIELKEPVAN